MAKRAHRAVRRHKLRQVAFGAGFMSGKTRRCRVVAALMTGGAGDGRVTTAVVTKSRVVERWTLHGGDKKASVYALCSLCPCGY